MKTQTINRNKDCDTSHYSQTNEAKSASDKKLQG